MSDATQPSESDFHDSHPIDDDMKDKTAPSIGDLTSIETSIDAPESQVHSIGDTSDIEDKQQSEILGDISLLDEAFAEMGEDSSHENSSQETSTLENTAPSDNNTDIPVLNETIDTPSESRIIVPDTENASIPMLDQEATIYAEMLTPISDAVMSKPGSKVSGIGSEDLASDIEDNPLFDSPEAQRNSNINELDSSLKTAAESLSEIEGESTAEISTFTASDNSIFSADKESESESESESATLEALLNDDNSLAEPPTSDIIADLHLDIASEAQTGLTSIDEKIAAASGDSEISINEIPISALSEPSDFSISFAEDLSNSIHEPIGRTEAETTRLADSAPGIDESDISEFNPDVDLNSTAGTQASHSIGITGAGQNDDKSQNSLNLSIPYELHSQLSHKIDELVIQATSSITGELHSQLTSKLDALLGNAVESVLPRLIDQMASELRTEVNHRIKRQLPIIINDVLNKTRLHK